MAIRFLSDEYMAAATEALAGREGLAADELRLSVQFRVTDPPNGDEPIRYHLTFGDGAVRMALGEVDDADVRITTGYDTAAGLAREEVRDQIAFLTGKLKVAGNMARLMANLSTFMEVRRTLKELDVEF
jgi:putative sterol carrier protein